MMVLVELEVITIIMINSIINITATIFTVVMNIEEGSHRIGNTAPDRLVADEGWDLGVWDGLSGDDGGVGGAGGDGCVDVGEVSFRIQLLQELLGLDPQEHL